MVFLKYLLLAATPAIVFAAGDGSGEYDIVPRAVNFLIFAAILYYLIAEPLRNLYRGRINSIADALDSISAKLKESQLKKDDALSKVEQAKVDAKAHLVTVKKEIENLRVKMQKELENELENLQKSHNEQIEIERRKMTRVMVTEVLEQIFSDEESSLDKDQLVNIVLKKAA